MTKSTRPYILRAFYEWIIDNNCTPYLVVNAEHDKVTVPFNYVKNGQIILNIAMEAVSYLKLGNENINFDARFKGIAHHIHIPLKAVIAIYANENNLGIAFSDDDISSPLNDDCPSKESTSKKLHLKIVK